MPAPFWTTLAESVSLVFLTLVKSLLAPLLFGLIVSSLGRRQEPIGRLGWWSIAYFEIVTGLAMFLGWALIAYFEPGRGIPLLAEASPAASVSVAALLVASVPDSGLRAMAANDVLPMILFFGLLGLAARTPKGQPFVAFAESVYAVTQQYAKYVMFLALPGMIAALAYGVLRGGAAAVEGMGRFVAAAIAAHLLVGVGLFAAIALAARLPIAAFLRECRPALLLAVTTTSSAAALPKAIEGMERFGVPRSTLGLVMPLGLSFNLAGSATQLMMASVFAAQAAGRALSFADGLLLWAVLKIAVKGVAGVPRANMVILSAVFPLFQLPLAALPLLLAVDAFIDMVRTPVNVLGNCLAPAVLDRWLTRRAATPAPAS